MNEKVIKNVKVSIGKHISRWVDRENLIISSMLDEKHQKPWIKTKKVRNRGKRSKTLSEVKPVKNIGKSPQSFLEISPIQKEVLPPHKLQVNAYE